VARIYISWSHDLEICMIRVMDFNLQGLSTTSTSASMFAIFWTGESQRALIGSARPWIN
jgi:hypothetical protein